MNNSVFGKTMENIRNRVDIRLCTQGKQIEKLIVKPNFRHRTISTENFVAVHMAKTNLTFINLFMWEFRYWICPKNLYMIFTTIL